MPDLVVGVDGVNAFVEIKNPNSGYGQAGFNKRQKKFSKDWKGSPVVIVRTHFDVVTHVGKMRIRAR